MTMGEARDQKSELSGVGGWLAFLCITLLVLTPLSMLVQIIAVLSVPNADTLDQTVGLGLGIGLGGFAAFAGYCLVRLRPNAVLITKAYLFVNMGFWVLIGLSAMLVPEAAAELSPRDIAQPIIVSSAWLAYLYRSERVRNTYAKSSVQDAADVFR